MKVKVVSNWYIVLEEKLAPLGETVLVCYDPKPDTDWPHIRTFSAESEITEKEYSPRTIVEAITHWTSNGIKAYTKLVELGVIDKNLK